MIFERDHAILLGCHYSTERNGTERNICSMLIYMQTLLVWDCRVIDALLSCISILSILYSLQILIAIVLTDISST